MVTQEPTISSWRMLDLSYNSAFMNLALEESLARVSLSGEVVPTVRFWTNPRAVVIGRFQDVSAEVDLAQCDLSEVEVARRFTGGGSVFHDEGTLNFTVVTQRSERSSVSQFQEVNSRLVLDALGSMGISCSFRPPNSLLVHGRKVSGAAAALGRNFALWHCSILVDADTPLLEAVLVPSKTSMATRFVRSNWQPVTTLSTELSRSVTIEDVKLRIISSIERQFSVKLEDGKLSTKEEEQSKDLLIHKYSLREWNIYGHQP